MKQEALLQVKNLSVRQREGPVLIQDISFGVGHNRCVGVIGESGSGKSIVCKAIMGLLPKRAFESSGAILYRGVDFLSISESSRNGMRGKEIAFVTQNPMTAFDPVFKIGNQIIETLRAHLCLSKRAAYDLSVAHLERMNLPRVGQLMNSYPHALSGGMLQRVMIAIALMMLPDLIIADEPTTALDTRTQAIVLEELQKIKDSGISMLVVSHDFGVIARIADEIIVMKDGRVIEQGSTQNILTPPGGTYTRELIDASILKKGE